MTDNLMTQITLDCLLNKEQYNKCNNNINSNNNSRKDKKFYKKRIYNLTKELLLSKEEVPYLFPDVRRAFEQYIYTCIQYFRAIDRNDIIQSDYQDIAESLNIGSHILEINDETINSKEEADKLLMKKIQLNHTLDKFVKRTVTTQNEPLFMPTQKDINLQDPSLKVKGVINSAKKKNIGI